MAELARHSQGLLFLISYTRRAQTAPARRQGVEKYGGIFIFRLGLLNVNLRIMRVSIKADRLTVSSVTEVHKAYVFVYIDLLTLINS